MSISPRTEPEDDASGTPFGERNRKRLIAKFFAGAGKPDTASAWKPVYRMLLWIDRTTGLAHCYESDKAQPGRPWYARSLAFHAWLASALLRTPVDVGDDLDWLFRAALDDYLKQLTAQHNRYRKIAEGQRAIYENQDFPVPGFDAEIRQILLEHLSPYLTTRPPDEVIEAVSEQLRQYWKQENKRKNLLGEGFEDVLAAVVEAAASKGIVVRTRVNIADVRGFSMPGARDKATKVDLVLEHPAWQRPALANVKWSIRADREDQLWDDFKEFVRFDRDQRGFDHYLVTNEFDPARLNAACDHREANNFVFRNVVHVNTDGVLAAYFPSKGVPAKAIRRDNDSSMEKVRQQVAARRLISLGDWLTNMTLRL